MSRWLLQGRAARGTAKLPTEIQSFSSSVKMADCSTLPINDI